MDDTSNYKKYKSKNLLKRIMVNRFKKKVCTFLMSFDNNQTLLDVGCGEGFMADYIFNNTNIKHIVGIDNNSKAIEYARGINHNIEYKKANIYNIVPKKNQHDIVICLEVLEHMKNPDTIIKKIYDCTKKRIIISVPREPFFSLGNLLFLKNVKRFGTPEEHINIWTKKKFREFLITNGIKEFHIYSTLFWIIVVADK